MRKKICAVTALSILFAGSAFASGWRIPEQSVDSTAKAGANIASAARADAAYFNPAKMSWMDDKWQVQADLTYIHLASIDYDDARVPLYNSASEEEHFLLPTGFLVSPDFSGLRFGMAFVAPNGLAKRWKSPYARAVAEEFSLKVFEMNPTVSYSFAEMVSVAGGARLLYADATLKNDAAGLGIPLGTDLNGQTFEWGWNLALDVQPVEGMDIAVTYRSTVDLDFEDEGDLNLMGRRLSNWDVNVSVPLPAIFSVSFAYDVLDNLNVELTWDRTYWSEYEALDINYEPQIPGNPFERPIVRNWNDTNAYRIGLTYQATSQLDLLLGFSFDENPIPDEKVDFSVPDSDAWIYSIGMQYDINEQMEIGAALLYDYKEDRAVKADPRDRVYGDFSGASALLFTLGLNYKF